VPFTVGGGITDLDQIQRLLRAGADKVTINTAAYADLRLIADGSGRFGAQCIVASIDARRLEDGRYECYSHAGTVATGREPVEWSRILSDHGAGEILITSIERDGSMQGYDLGLIESIARAVNLPVIASGGAGTYEHMRLAIQQAGASAVAAGAMFHYTEQTPAEAKRYLAEAGIPMRANYIAAGASGCRA
jgi:cyclase